MASEQDIWELIVKTIGADKVKEMTELLVGLNEEADKVEDVSTKAAKGTRDMGRATLEASRALEDLQYGLAGVMNNLPGLVTTLGGPAGLAGIISIVAVGAMQLYNNWDKLMNLFEDKQPFPKAGADIAGMKRELEGAKDEMEKMEKASTGTVAELEKYNALRARTADLETKIADQMERQSTLKKLTEAPTEEAEGRAKGFQEATKGRFQETQSKIEAALDQRDQAELDAAWNARTASVQRVKDQNLSAQEETRQVESINAVYQQQKKDIQARIAESGKTAEDLMLALHEGDEQAGRTLDVLMRGSADLFGDLKQRMDAANPGLKKQADEAAKAAKDAAKANEDIVKAVEELADEKQKAIDQEVDEWAKEGEDFLAEQKRAATARTKAFDLRQQLAVKENKPFIEQETRTIKEGGLAEQAEAMLAEAQHFGGAMIRGRPRKLTPDQQFEFVRQQAAQQLKQDFPRMPAQQREDMATRVTAMGKKGLEQRMLGLQAQGVQAVDRTQAAMEMALQAVQQIVNRQMRQGANADRLGRGFQAMAKHGDQMQPGAGNTGGH